MYKQLDSTFSLTVKEILQEFCKHNFARNNNLPEPYVQMWMFVKQGYIKLNGSA